MVGIAGEMKFNKEKHMCSFNGFIDKADFLGGSYSYYFDGKNLHLNKINDGKKTIHYITSSQNVKFLNTRLSSGGSASFYDCNYYYNNILSSREMTIAPASCLISRYANIPISEFSGLVFSGKVIDKLFPPSQIVKYDSLNLSHIKNISKLKRDGSKTIVLKSFGEVDKSFKFKYNKEQYNILFNISSPGTILKGDKNLGEIKSNFTLKFKEKQPIENLEKIYIIVRKLFQFLSNIKDIAFDEIKVLLNSNDDNYEYIGDFYDLIHTKDENDYSIICPVELYFSHIDKVFLNISNEKINFNYIPKNKSQIYTINPEQYVSCCGAFEYNYKKVFKEDLITYNKIIEDFDNSFIKNKEYNRKERNFCKKIKDIMQNESQSLESKYQHALVKYNEALSGYIHHLSGFYAIASNPQKLNIHFSSRRNIDAHGEMEPFSQESICAYLVGNAIIDCLILDKCGFGTEEIKKIIDKRYMK